MDTVMAATLREEIDHVAQIEAMIAQRRDPARRGVARGRALPRELCGKLREAIAEVENSDPHAAGIVPQSPAEPEAV